MIPANSCAGRGFPVKGVHMERDFNIEKWRHMGLGEKVLTVAGYAGFILLCDFAFIAVMWLV